MWYQTDYSAGKLKWHDMKKKQTNSIGVLLTMKWSDMTDNPQEQNRVNESVYKANVCYFQNPTKSFFLISKCGLVLLNVK